MLPLPSPTISLPALECAINHLPGVRHADLEMAPGTLVVRVEGVRTAASDAEKMVDFFGTGAELHVAVEHTLAPWWWRAAWWIGKYLPQ